MSPSAARTAGPSRNAPEPVVHGSTTRRSAMPVGTRPWFHSHHGPIGPSTAARASTRSEPARSRRPPRPPAPDRARAPAGEIQSMGVIIIREMVGTSPKPWSHAARQAGATASRTVRNIKTVEVVHSSAKVEDGEIVEYRVEIKIGFEYEG